MSRLTNPTPLFLNGRGTLLDGGYIYVGAAGTDPTNPANQLPIFWDRARTIPAAQPLRTVGGVIVNGDDPAYVYFAAENYSLAVQDVDRAVVSFATSVADSTTPYQPLNSGLTVLAGIPLGAFGVSLLTLGDSSSLKADLGVNDKLDATFRNLPLTTQTSSFMVVPGMRGGAVLYLGGGDTATLQPESVLPWATSDVAAVLFYNNGGGPLVFTRGSGVFLKKNGSTLSSEASLAVGGEAVLKRWSFDYFTITGTGLS